MRSLSCLLTSLGASFVALFSPIAVLAAPLVAGDYAIANTFLHGDAHVMLVGDSEQNGTIGYYPALWHIDHWAGVSTFNSSFSGNSGVFTFAGTPSSVSSVGNYGPGDTTPDGIPNLSPASAQHVVFSGATAGPASTLFTNRFYEYDLAPDQASTYYGGKWADTSTGNLTVSLLKYLNPNGSAPGNVQLDVRINSDTTAVASAPVSTKSASGYQTQSVTFGAQAWNPGRGVDAGLSVIAGATPAAGSNLDIAAARITTGGHGFEFTNISKGGEGVDYFLDPTLTSDAALSQYMNFADVNTTMIWLGQNDQGPYDPAAWKEKMQALVSRYKADKPGTKFILVSTYDTGNAELAGYAEDLYQIAQSDPSNVLFLNLYASAGDFSTLDANYLADHVHANVAGLTYFADQTNSLLELAASQAPEPASLSIFAVGAVAVLRRRRSGSSGR